MKLGKHLWEMDQGSAPIFLYLSMVETELPAGVRDFVKASVEPACYTSLWLDRKNL